MPVKVKNWKKFQHFKDRRPPWIKLYRDILDDPDWHKLDGPSAKHLVMLWLIASENDGYLPCPDKLCFRLRMSKNSLTSLLSKLKHWFDVDDINASSRRYINDAPEGEAEAYKAEREAEAEKSPAAPTPTKFFFEGTHLKITECEHRKLCVAFPEVDVASCYQDQDIWQDAHPSRRKKNSYAAMLNWLKNERVFRAERQGSAGVGAGPKTPESTWVHCDPCNEDVTSAAFHKCEKGKCPFGRNKLTEARLTA